MLENYPKIDPNLVPLKRLRTGDQIPVVGLGTFGSDHVTPDQVAEAVKGAIHTGYRHIDCAMVYRNEKEIGQAIKETLDEGIVTRKELWITSKLWNDKHAEEDVIPTCQQTLKDLQLDYLDLYLVHWPFPNHHAPGVDVDSRDPHAMPYIHENFMKTWRQMEKLVELGLVRNIGTSNMTIPKLELLLRDAAILPATNEMELHPHFQQPELFQYCVDHEIQPIGFSPIGSPNRPERDKAPGDTIAIQDPVLVEIAKKHSIHPAVVCIKWAVQRGQVPIPFSTTPRNYHSNLEAVIRDPLSADEMKAIAEVDQNCRLIKGQVFLWESAKDWTDLWDLDGKIAGI